MVRSQRLRYDLASIAVALACIIIAVMALRIPIHFPILNIARWVGAAIVGMSGVFLGIATLARLE